MTKRLFFLVVFTTLFSGCVANRLDPPIPTSILSEESSINTTVIPNVTPPIIGEDVSITPSSTATITWTASMAVNIDVPATPESTLTIMLPSPTTTTLGTKVIDSNTSRLCSTMPMIFNFRNALGINFVTGLRFENEDLLTFEGWAPGQIDIPIVTPESTASPSTFAPGSSFITLKAGGVDLVSGNLFTRTLDFAPLLNNPCQKQCTTQIWGQSPNKQWQLVQVSLGTPEEIGVWLINEEDKIQLVPYVPPDNHWQWARDNSLLWYTFYDREYGVYADAISLKLPLNTNFHGRSENDPVNPLTHIVAFSPEDKTLLSTMWDEDSNELYTIDLTTSTPAIALSEVIPGLVALTWNEATESYLLEIAGEDGLEFRDTQGLKVSIPIELINMMYPAVAQGMVDLQKTAPKAHFVISPSGKYLAIAYNNGEIEVFSCQ